MRIQGALAVLIIIMAAASPLHADKAASAYKRGIAAEAHEQFDDALADYKEAYDLKPTDIRYKAAYTRMRFNASTAHVHQGQLLHEQGKLPEALAEFQRALEIDPASFIAQQEIRKTKAEIESGKTAPASPPPAPPQSSLDRIVQEAEGPVELKPISNAPINLRMTEDTKVIYTTIGKLAGINVLFDPDYTSRRITIELNNVTLNQALQIVALESKTFWRPVTSNTIFVASDTQAKRKELEQSVIKTIYLSNVSTPNDLQDMVNAIRTILDVRQVQQIASQNAIVLRGTPDQVAVAEKLVSDIDKAKPEVLVEVAVMQVSRNLARTLGINPPQSMTVQLQSNVTTTTTTAASSQGSTTTPATVTTGSTTSLTLNDLANLNAKNFAVTIPPATVSFMMTDANTKIIQNPQIRALDNQKATLKIGDRVPVATGSFQPGIGGVGINPLVNTQFQYLDVGVNVDITPHIHAGREVTMKMTLEISSVTGTVNIGGIQQPTIGQRKIEHEIRLKEGETNLISGFLEDSDVTSLTGYPWLSKIPILRYFFAQDQKTRMENEIVFAVTPHIVRSQDVSELNLRPLDVGTANFIGLRRAAATTPPSPAPQQPGGGAPTNGNHTAMPPTAAPQAATAPPSQAPPPAATAPPPAQTNQAAAPSNTVAAATPPPAPNNAAPASLSTGSAVMSFQPANISANSGGTFMVNVSMSGAENVYAVPAQISYDPKLLQLVNISTGDFLSKDGQTVALVHRDDAAAGTVQVTATRPPGSGGVGGSGAVFTLTFMARTPGQAVLNINKVQARDPNNQTIPVVGGQAMVSVH